MCLRCILEKVPDEQVHELSMLNAAYKNLVAEGEIQGSFSEVVIDFVTMCSEQNVDNAIVAYMQDGMTSKEAVGHFAAGQMMLGLAIGVACRDFYAQTRPGKTECSDESVEEIRERMQAQIANANPEPELPGVAAPQEIVDILKKVGLVPEEFSGEIRLADMSGGVPRIELVENPKEDDEGNTGLYL